MARITTLLLTTSLIVITAQAFPLNAAASSTTTETTNPFKIPAPEESLSGQTHSSSGTRTSSASAPVKTSVFQHGDHGVASINIASDSTRAGGEKREDQEADGHVLRLGDASYMASDGEDKGRCHYNILSPCIE